MKVILAPDSFKESMSATEAVEAMERGVLAVFPDAECIRVPMADGGEGTTEALTAALGGEIVDASTHDALGRPITARYGYVSDRRLAVVEVAAAAGIDLVAPADRDPLTATSFGVGELVRDALDRGARRLVVGLGGSVTNDGGAGMLQALGAHLLDADGRELGVGGAELARLARIDVGRLDPRLREVEVEVASDVTNPLLGPNGASLVFGPQKGATQAMVARLDAALEVYARVISATTGVAVAAAAGAGAAGGMGAAFLAFFRARVRSGIEVVATAARLAEQMDGADLVLTGEGSVDSQTLGGKTPFGVARVAQAHGVPVVVFAGRVGDGVEVLLDRGVVAVVPIVRGVTDLATALAQGSRNLELAVEMVCRVVATAQAGRWAGHAGGG